jgi:hypothetical protein
MVWKFSESPEFLEQQCHRMTVWISLSASYPAHTSSSGAVANRFAHHRARHVPDALQGIEQYVFTLRRCVFRSLGAARKWAKPDRENY